MPTTRLKRIEAKRKYLAILLLILVALVIVGFTFLIIKLIGFYNNIHTPSVTNGDRDKPKNIYNILLLGYGGGRHQGAYLTDTMMVAHVDLEKKKVVLISIPRDIWVKVPTKSEPFYSKINAVYQMGLYPEDYPDLDTRFITSSENPSGIVKKVVSDVTGLKIDYYVAVDFQGFVNAIDTLGGIEINVDKSFTDPEYPIEGKEDDLCGKEEKDLPELEKIATESAPLAFPCRYETLTFTKGVTHMDGSTALKFTRSRHSNQDGGDFRRAQRQQQVIEAVKNKVLSINFIPKIVPFVDELGDHITTDIKADRFILEGSNANKYSVATYVISDELTTQTRSENGQSILIPQTGIDKWEEIQTVISNRLKGITPTPTKLPVTITPTDIE